MREKSRKTVLAHKFENTKLFQYNTERDCSKKEGDVDPGEVLIQITTMGREGLKQELTGVVTRQWSEDGKRELRLAREGRAPGDADRRGGRR